MYIMYRSVSVRSNVKTVLRPGIPLCWH